MTHYKFYKREEVKRFKREGGVLQASFGITTDQKTLKGYVVKYELEQEYIWMGGE